MSAGLRRGVGSASPLDYWQVRFARPNRLVRTHTRSWCGRGSGATRTPIPIVCYQAFSFHRKTTWYLVDGSLTIEGKAARSVLTCY